MIRVNIVILNWNQPELTINTIGSVKKISHRFFQYHITLVDNGSSDDSKDKFTKIYGSDSQVSLVLNKHNLGYVDGNNSGIKLSLEGDFDYILIINNDVLVKPDFLDQLIGFSQSNPQYSILGPKIYFAPGHEFHYSRYKKGEIGRVIWSAGGRIDWNNVIGSNIGVDEVDSDQYDVANNKVDFISGCCLLAKKEVFSKIGLFDSKYFLYLEDVDFCQRAVKAGFKMVYVPDSVIWHINAGSSKSGGDLHHYFLSRNRLIFGFRYARLKTKLALFRQSLQIILRPPSLWHRYGVLDYYLGNLNRGRWR